METRGLAIGALVLGLTLVLPAASAGHADGLDFVLTGQQHPDFEASDNPDEGILTQITDSHPEQGTLDAVALETGCRVWVADEPAQIDLSYAPQELAYEVDLVGEEAPQDVSVEVGKYSSDDEFVRAGGETLTQSSLLGTVSGQFPTQKLLIEKGEYSATRICVSAVNPGLVAVDTAGGDSQTTYTSEDGTYPTPELGSLALSGLGMLALVGLARFRRST